jgi:hypothetical protein
VHRPRLLGNIDTALPPRSSSFVERRFPIGRVEQPEVGGAHRRDLADDPRPSPQRVLAARHMGSSVGDKERAEAIEKHPAVRERIAKDAESMYADLAAFFKHALEADRKVWVTCSHCDRRTGAEIPDWTARAKAVEMMLNQGFGRPPSGDPDGGGGGFILKRIIVAPDGAEIVTGNGAVHAPPLT